MTILIYKYLLILKWYLCAYHNTITYATYTPICDPYPGYSHSAYNTYCYASYAASSG